MLKHARIEVLIIKMKNIKNKSFKKSLLSAVASFGIVTIFAISILAHSLVQADRFQEQIDALNAENSQKQAVQGQLGNEAASLADTISKLQAQINSLQAQIVENQKKAEELRAQIAAAELELAKQKDLLGQTIKAMYIEGEITTVEMLASSKDLSDYFDKQQYQESVRSKVKSTVDKITQLKLDLNTQKETLEKLIADQQIIQGQVAAQRAEQDRLLALNQGEQAALDQQIRANNGKVAQLRAEQAAENAKRFRGSGVKVIAGSNGNDTYPNIWRNSPQDSLVDSWGMYNRECVSWTAWKVHYSGRYMPYWGGVGNANQWDDNARRAGIPVDGNPRPGDVAVAHWGFYGHVMYVESVNPNGTINISQYNYDFNGTYSEAYNFPTAGLVFIHFP